MMWMALAYLDVDPFFLRQGLKLLHEDALGHGGEIREYDEERVRKWNT